MIEVGEVGAADQELRCRRRHRRPDVDELERRVVAGHHPRADVLALLERDAAPGLVARLARGGDGAAAPQLLAGHRVVGHDDACVGAAARRAAPPRDHLAVGDNRTRRLVGGVRPVVEDLRLPDLPTGGRVEGEDVLVDAGVDDVPAVDGEAPVDFRQAAEQELVDVLGHFAPVLPEEIAGGGVDRLDHVPRVGHVEDAVVGERRALLAPRVEPARPDQAQVADVVRVDLIEGAVAPAVERPAPHEPVVRGGGLEHGVGDRDELAVRRLGARGVRPRGDQQRDHGEEQQAGRPATPLRHGPLLVSSS